MIMCYVLVIISGLGLFQIGLNHYFDFFITNRISFDLIVSIIFIAAQTLVMFFFVGTGVNVREYLEAHPHNELLHIMPRRAEIHTLAAQTS